LATQTPAHAGAADAAELQRHGYRQEFERTIHRFASFAVAFSFISITTGIFTTYGLVLTTSGPVGIWTWIIAALGQLAVSLVFGSFAARIPLTGYSYQWFSRLANPVAGWCLGWISFTFLAVVVCSVDYALAQVVFPTLFGYTGTETNEWLVTAAILVAQALLIAYGTRQTSQVNNAAVATELIGIVGLTVLLIVVAALKGDIDFGNLFTKGAAAHTAGYGHFGLTALGPLWFAFLLGAYTIVGFESAANLAEETSEPHRVVPRAMWTAVALSGLVGLVFLIAVTVAAGDTVALAKSGTPVADVVTHTLGNVIGKVFLVLVSVSIFACGLVIMLTNVRLTWAMSRDRRFPLSGVLRRIDKRHGTPVLATVFVLVIAEVILAVFAHNSKALVNLFSASTLLPAIIYLLTVGLYLVKRRSLPREEGFHLGRLEIPALVVAVVWLVFEVLIFRDASFKDPRLYVLVMFAIGAVYLAWLLISRGGPKGLAMPRMDSPDAELDAAAR
jgi:amino acid transporter